MTALVPSGSPLSLPDDLPRALALGAAVLVAWLVPRWLGSSRAARSVVPGCALIAVLLSAAYVTFVLRGGPRIIDATSYWLQARALADGWLAFPIGEPEQSVLGRFLLRTDAPVSLAEVASSWLGGGHCPASLPPAGPGGAAVIFPPGYPAVLAVGFLFGVPLAVGPLLGGALVIATAALGEAVERALRTVESGGVGASAARTGQPPRLAHVAALFSALSPAMRYHTADTMAHGLAALCFAVGLGAVLHAFARTERGQRGMLLGLSGLATGWLAATRPASALALGLCVLLVVLGVRTPASGAARHWLGARGALSVLVALGLGATPGILLWLAHQRAATGSAWGSAQSLYYALSDGPAGCFGYGFGRAIGCLGEHGTFVGHNLSDGYGLVAALGTTGRRLQHHLPDALGFSPLFLLVPLGAWLGRPVPAVRVLGIGVVAQLAAYAPFYFDGNYPGGGARMLADALPLEHVLAAVALRGLAARAPAGRPSGRGLAGAAAACILVGFALQSGADHAQLREREGGAPMLQPRVLASVAEGAGRGALVLVDTDHGLNLGLRPASAPAETGASVGLHREPAVRRYRGDGIDRLTWEALGRPPTFRYRFEPAIGATVPAHFADRFGAWLDPMRFDDRPTGELALRIEGESLWPAREQQGGWAWPVKRGAAGASGDGWLRVLGDRCAGKATSGAARQVRLALPARWLGGRALRIRARLTGSGAAESSLATAEIAVMANGSTVARTSMVSSAAPTAAGLWRELIAPTLPAELTSLELVVSSEAEVDLDYVELGPQNASLPGR